MKQGSLHVVTIRKQRDGLGVVLELCEACLIENGKVMVGWTADGARQVAAKLLERADEIES